MFSEPFVARQQGGDPRALLASDIGFNPICCSVVIATEETIAQRADIVRALVEASIEGWEHYLRDGQETNKAHKLAQSRNGPRYTGLRGGRVGSARLRSSSQRKGTRPYEQRTME